MSFCDAVFLFVFVAACSFPESFLCVLLICYPGTFDIGVRRVN